MEFTADGFSSFRMSEADFVQQAREKASAATGHSALALRGVTSNVTPQGDPELVARFDRPSGGIFAVRMRNFAGRPLFLPEAAAGGAAVAPQRCRRTEQTVMVPRVGKRVVHLTETRRKVVRVRGEWIPLAQALVATKTRVAMT